MPYKNKESQKIHDRRYYRENKEKRKAYAKQHYQENKEQIILLKKQYYHKNKEYWVAHGKLYRQELRKKTLKLFGNRCYFCHENGKKYRMEFHNKATDSHPDYSIHLILKNPEEWALLCHDCHRGVHFCAEHLEMTWNQIISIAKLP